jgi:two-component system NarL family sensor kinase
MKLKAKILMLAVAPLLLAIALIGGLLVVETKRLEQQQAQLLEDTLLSTKRDELRSYIALALTSIDHLYGAGRDDQAAKEQAKAILSNMTFGDDGYFFVYADDGLNLVHPRQPDLIGTNLWNMRDSDGTYVIRELIARAREGAVSSATSGPSRRPARSSASSATRWAATLGLDARYRHLPRRRGRRRREAARQPAGKRAPDAARPGHRWR